MLFNSTPFIFIFLPLTLSVFFLLGRKSSPQAALIWLVAASLFYYGWWNPLYLTLIIGSLLVNYALGSWLGERVGHRTWLLAFGVAANLGLLGYYKYAGFLALNWNAVAGTDYHLKKIILPLAISFFTFQQIAYLVDAHRGLARETNFLRYALFVTFFPQLIAGPIVHHAEMLPQFGDKKVFRFNPQFFAEGLTMFTLGLFKKIVFADTLAGSATAVFAAADGGESLTFFVAWGGALAYTLQLYFDFSGYSEMALGLGRMFGIRLPVNFFSPYRATNIIEFWRRWHITLSRFLRDYLYISLGGNRRGHFRRYLNMFITMVLGGLWHGAGWTFVLWGALHGLYLTINHISRALWKGQPPNTKSWKYFSAALTFLAVVVGWVFFRAETFGGAMALLKGMAGGNGLALPLSYLERLGAMGQWLAASGVAFKALPLFQVVDWRWIILLLPFVWFAPNVPELMARFAPYLPHGLGKGTDSTQKIGWKPSARWAGVIGVLFVLAVLGLTRASEFLYYQF